MFRKLCVTVVFIYSVIMVADIHARNSFISKSINLTTLIGKSVEFNCSEHNTESRKYTMEFTWLKNEESLNKIIRKYSHKMSLAGYGNVIRIINVTKEDAATYKCITFNQSHSDNSIYTLTVNDLQKPKTYQLYTSNITASYGLSVYIRCMRYAYYDRSDSNSQNHRIFKDEKPLHLDNKRMEINKDSDLAINNITNKDTGKYECETSNEFRIDHAVIYLNAVDEKNLTYFYEEIVNQTDHLSDTFFAYRYGEQSFKNDKPFESSEENTQNKFHYNNTEFKIENLTFEDAGNYNYNLSNPCQTFNLSYSLNLIDHPEKLSFRLFTSNISLNTRETLELKCHIFQSVNNFKTWYSWKKNGEKLELDDDNKTMYCINNQSMLVLSNFSSNEIGTYECEAESYYHKVYSAYTLTISDKKNYTEFNLILSYSTYIVAFILVGFVTILCCILGLTRKKTTAKDSKENKSQRLNDNLEERNVDLNKEENIYEPPYENIYEEINYGLRLENSIEGQIYALPCDNISEVINSPLNRSSISGENSIEEQIYVLPHNHISEVINSPLNQSTMSGENSEQAENPDEIEMEQIFHKLKLFNQGKKKVKKFVVKQKNNH